MEFHSVMDDENYSRRDVELYRGYMLDMVDYYVNLYRKLGEVFGQMIHARMDELNELVVAQLPMSERCGRMMMMRIKLYIFFGSTIFFYIIERRI